MPRRTAGVIAATVSSSRNSATKPASKLRVEKKTIAPAAIASPTLDAERASVTR